MRRSAIGKKRWLAGGLVLAVVIAGAPARAGKPDHAGKPEHAGGSGNEKGGKPSKARSSQGGSGGGSGGGHAFSSSQRDATFDWYHESYGDGCPPGLAKKHNGCLPPGQAKKRYAIGHPLPPGVVLGPIPSALAILLGAPPAGYRYGILDGDVVKLAIGTALVVDAIEGLANR